MDAALAAVLAEDPDAPAPGWRLGRRADVAALAVDRRPGPLDALIAAEEREGPAAAVAGPKLRTEGQRRRFRRDLVIYLAHRRNGLSQRLLADVFDLPRSRVADIIATLDGYQAAR